MKVEYRVRPVTRYIVTRYHEEEVDCADGKTGMSAGCEERGEFDRADTAYEVAYALCKAEHEASGEPPGSMNFTYPQHPNDPAECSEIGGPRPDKFSQHPA